MKYPDDKYLDMGESLLPTFLVLLKCRTVQESLRDSDLNAGAFLQAIESFIFLMINIADPVVMETNRINSRDYLIRRSELLKSLGLFEYLNETMLMKAKEAPPFTSPN